MVVFWKQNELTQRGESGKEVTRTLPLLRYYRVFNVEQFEGLNLPAIATNDIKAIAAAEAIVAGMPAAPSIAHDGGGRAFYRSDTDSIHLPPVNSSDSADEYYSATFHGLVHSPDTPAGCTATAFPRLPASDAKPIAGRDW
jgi:antirestriction protein ArdC